MFPVNTTDFARLFINNYLFVGACTKDVWNLLIFVLNTLNIKFGHEQRKKEKEEGGSKEFFS